MNLADFAPQSIAFKVIGIALTVLVVLGLAYEVTQHYESVGYQRRVAEEQIQRSKDLEVAAQATQALQNQLDEAQHELSVTKQKLATLASSNVVLVSQLRHSLTTYNSTLSDDSKQTLSERVLALSQSLNECSERYSDLATKADSYAADLKMMQDAWPK